MGLFKRSRSHATPRTVLAAAIPLEGPQKVSVGRAFKAGTLDWQNTAWHYYDAVGEFRSAITWVANLVSKADVHAAEIDPDTNTVGSPTEDARVQQIAAAVLGGMARRSQLLQTLAVHWQVPGESFIIVRPQAARQGVAQPDEWLVLSGRKVIYKGSQWTYMDPGTMRMVILTPTDLLIRLWSPHPDDPALSDSAARPALPILQEIEKSSQHIAANLDSRLGTAGVHAVPAEMNFPRGEGTLSDALTDYFVDAASTNIKSPGAAEARVPIFLEMPAEHIASFVAGRVDYATEFQGQVVDLRTAALGRLAATLDMPNETAEGSTGGMNHWGAWQVEESTYKIYIEPLLDRIADALTAQWFIPALTAAGVATPERYVLAWDTSSIVARPDRTGELMQLWDKVLISDDYLRAEMGIPDEAIPSTEEKRRREMLGLVDGAPTLLADPNIGRDLFGFEIAPAAVGVDPGASDVAAGEDAPAALPPAPAARPDEDADVPDGLVAAAEFAVYDALSRAGKRLLTREHRGQFGQVKAEHLYLSIPHTRHPDDLLEGSFAFIDGVAHAWDMDPSGLRRVLDDYCALLLQERNTHDRNLLRCHLRVALR